jgi:hypothetical protein
MAATDRREQFRRSLRATIEALAESEVPLRTRDGDTQAEDEA